MKIATLLLVVLLALLGCSYQSVTHSTEKNLAYEDSFVWFIAWRLSLQTFGFFDSETLKPEYRAQYLGDLALTYHRKLISCDGPLEEVAKKLGYFGWTKTDALKTLAFVGQLESSYWPIISKWEKIINFSVMRKLVTGDISSHWPNCIVDGYIKPEPPG